ncbi:MAG: cation-translocating P-type ATPase [Solirubrobacterales bacterium]
MVCGALGTDPESGLSVAEAEVRLRRAGPNRIPETPPPSRLALLARQLANPMVALLALASAISLAIGDSLDAGVIVAIAAANTVLGYVQEGRAEGATRRLRTLVSPTARVRRDGRLVEVSAGLLVVGDLVAVRPGDRVPADSRLLRANRLEVDESALTGESLPLAKQPEPVAEDAPVAERSCMVFAGTIVTRGDGEALVTATGADTEIGRAVAEALRVPPTPTPLQRRVRRFAGFLLRAAGLLCVTLAAIAWLQGDTLTDSILIGVSLAVAAVPEGLPAVLTIALAIGVQRMAERGAIARRLEAVETLGSTTVICADKTGTLTENRMSLALLYPCEIGRELVPDGTRDGKATDDLLGAALLASDELARRSGGGSDLGAEPTEAAIAAAAARRGLEAGALLAGATIAHVEPFDSERKRMSVTIESSEGRISYAKGAPEVMLERLVATADRSSLAKLAGDWAERGMRVLLVARRELSEGDEPESQLTPVGLLALHDPPRPGVARSLEGARAAGVRTVMITGDHPRTALAVAQAISVVEPRVKAEVLTGPELDGLSDEELLARSRTVDVYARVVPQHKLRIVDALRRRGEVVAMTGDGVNDVPALEAAHVGVAMGGRGTDAARAAADLILTDDDYSTIVEAIRSGRAIYENVLRFVHFLLAANAGEVMVFAFAITLGLQAPLTVVQILLVNLLTDGPPAVALAVDPPERDGMRRPPRPPTESMLEPIRARLLVGGAATGLAAFAAFLIGQGTSHSTGQTMAFATLVFAQLAHVFSVRGTDWFFRAGRNLVLVAAVLVCAALQAIVLAVPTVAGWFDVVALSSAQLASVLALAAVPLLSAELFKALTRSGPPHARPRGDDESG